MRRLEWAGMAPRLLCLPLSLLILSSCGQHRQVGHKLTEGEETEQLLSAIKENPSVKPGSNEAGPPIKVNPYPPSAGMNAKHSRREMPHH